MSLPISHAKIAELELALDVANYHCVMGEYGNDSGTVAIVMSGQEFPCEYRYSQYYGVSDGMREDPVVTYMRARVNELKEDQELIRKYCYS